MRKTLIILTTVLAATLAQASTNPAAVARLNKERAGKVKQLISQEYKKNHAVECQGLSKTKIIQISSDSYNQEKRPGTMGDDSGHFLVIQQCHAGATYAGAVISAQNMVLMKASFESSYDSNGGPEKMENLKIEKIGTLEDTED